MSPFPLTIRHGNFNGCIVKTTEYKPGKKIQKEDVPTPGEDGRIGPGVCDGHVARLRLAPGEVVSVACLVAACYGRRAYVHCGPLQAAYLDVGVAVDACRRHLTGSLLHQTPFFLTINYKSCRLSILSYDNLQKLLYLCGQNLAKRIKGSEMYIV